MVTAYFLMEAIASIIMIAVVVLVLLYRLPELKQVKSRYVAWRSDCGSSFCAAALRPYEGVSLSFSAALPLPTSRIALEHPTDELNVMRSLPRLWRDYATILWRVCPRERFEMLSP